MVTETDHPNYLERISIKDNSYQAFVMNVPNQLGAIFPGMKERCMQPNSLKIIIYNIVNDLSFIKLLTGKIFIFHFLNSVKII